MALVMEVELVGIEAMSRTQVINVLKAANKKLGLRWRRFMLPAHFTETGERRYRFKGRSKRYRKSKLEAKGHHHDLVFSGEGKRLALANKKVFVTRNSVKIPLPRKFNFRPKAGVINMADEIRAVTNKEAKNLTEFLTVQIDREFAKATGQGPSRVKSASISVF